MRKLKTTYNMIRDKFEKENFVLLTSEKDFISINKTLLEYECKSGHICKIILKTLKYKIRCPYCSNRKIWLPDIIKSFKSENYTILNENNIKNSKSFIEFICNSGHKHKITWNNWKKGVRCAYCMNKKISFGDIQKSFEKEGYKLLIKEGQYQNARVYMEYICPNGHKHKITWSNWKEGKRCPICVGKGKRSYDYKKEQIEREGYKILKSNNPNYLKYICPNGHKHRTTWSNWRSGYRCPICSLNLVISKAEKEIKEIVKQLTNENIIENDRSQIINPKTNHNLELDIWIPSLNKAIEFNGEYWHDNDYSKYKDNQKIKQCREKNIDLLVINEENWIENKNNEINKIIRFIEEVCK